MAENCPIINIFPHRISLQLYAVMRPDPPIVNSVKSSKTWDTFFGATTHTRLSNGDINPLGMYLPMLPVTQVKVHGNTLVQFGLFAAEQRDGVLLKLARHPTDIFEGADVHEIFITPVSDCRLGGTSTPENWPSTNILVHDAVVQLLTVTKPVPSLLTNSMNTNLIASPPDGARIQARLSLRDLAVPASVRPTIPA
jgi:hypothetical protein